MEISRELLLEMYERMQRIRQFEQKLIELSRNAELPGAVHTSIGEEGSAVGVCTALLPSDRITSTHRGHGHLIAKGGDVRLMMAEIFGRRTGYCKGKGGSMHIADFSLGILGANGIVGGGIPIATGSALAAMIARRDDVSACFFGDGASNEGTFHESLNLAAVWKLPVVYICENNLYGEFTPMTDVTSVRDIAVRAKSYDIPGQIVDGNNVLEVHHYMSQAVARARRGEGPTLLECKTYRWEGHFSGEAAILAGKNYRPQEEIDAWKARCPILRFEREMLASGKLSREEMDRIVQETAAEIGAAVEFARNSPPPQAAEATQDLFVE